jgi:hypothetical protein
LHAACFGAELASFGVDVCLDTHLRHYGVLEDGKLSILEA